MSGYRKGRGVEWIPSTAVAGVIVDWAAFARAGMLSVRRSDVERVVAEYGEKEAVRVVVLLPDHLAAPPDSVDYDFIYVHNDEEEGALSFFAQIDEAVFQLCIDRNINCVVVLSDDKVVAQSAAGLAADYELRVHGLWPDPFSGTPQSRLSDIPNKHPRGRFIFTGASLLLFAWITALLLLCPVPAYAATMTASDAIIRYYPVAASIAKNALPFVVVLDILIHWLSGSNNKES